MATLGSYVGSIVNYWVFRWVGQPVAMKYGKYVLVPADKLLMAEEWLKRFGMPGVFAARFLPVVRHLISIPAGILRMPVAPFTIATVLGAGAWCAILAWFGQEVLGSHPELLDSPEAMMIAIKAKLAWIVLAMLAFLALYTVVIVFKRRTAAEAA
jgi:membrane protein DedA with SNARE-associated domain